MNTWEFPGLDISPLIMTSTNESQRESLWSIHWAYQAYQKEQVDLQASLAKQAYIAKERSTTGYRTRRHAPEGYVAVTRHLARKVYESGKEVTLCGNNVNSYHIFTGWYLGYTIHQDDENKTDYNGRAVDFQEIIDNFLVYLERELGTYAVFYVRKEDV